MTLDSNDVLIIGLNYTPEKTGNAPYTSGLANGLAAHGRSPRVITGFPHYPEWKIHEGFDGTAATEEQVGHVRVRRVPHFIPNHPFGLARVWLELSFGLRAATCRWKKPAVVVLVSPALLSSGIMLLRGRLTHRSVPKVVWVQDIYSLGMTETGTSRSVGGRLMALVEATILRRADGIVVIHDRFKQYLVTELGVDSRKVRVIRNWTHLRPLSFPDRAASRRSFGWKDEDIVVLHAGNMGLKQGLENVVEAAKVAQRRNSRVRFVLLGNGNQRRKLEALAVGVDHIDFLDSLTQHRFQEALAVADVLLVNELPGVKEMSVPSKLTSYFSSGVPVLAATDVGSVTAEEIETVQAGLRVDAGAPADLVRGAEMLADKDLGRQYAANARHFMDTMLSEEHAVAQYDDYLTHLTAGPQPDTGQDNTGEHNA